MRTITAIAGLLGLTAALSGCALTVGGTSQKIVVNTTPPGAACDFVRQGKIVAMIDRTPGSARVSKSKHDITIVCRLPGYDEASYYEKSGVEPAVFADIAGGLLIGGVMAIVDGSSGADNHYRDQIDLVMSTKVVPPPGR